MELPRKGYRHRVVEVLQDLIRIDTTNPPGNETACARYLADLLEPAGIETRIVESAPGRGNLIARLHGEGHAKPLMLMGHLDVVSADPSEWTYPPFAAEIHDGFIWGRGTTDMKHMVAASAITLLALADLEHPLKRDIVFAATADEEHGGHMGMGWLAREMPELLDVACAINEGGGGVLDVAGHRYYTCQSAERGLCRTIWTAQADGGHASRPRADLSTLKLSRAVSRLGDGYLRACPTQTMRTALHTITATRSEQIAERVDALLERGQIEEALRTAGFESKDIDRHKSLFYDTASVTGLRAGDPNSINVIPSTATAYVDGRILPDQTREGFLDLLRQCAGDEVDIQVYRDDFSPGLEASVDAPIFQTIAEVISDRCDGALLIPWQSSGSTDAKNLRSLGVPVYGFIPEKPMPAGETGKGAHAVDERLWLEALPFAVEVLYDIVYRFSQRA